MANEDLTNIINDLTCTIPSIYRKMWAVNNNLLLQADINKSHVSVLFTLSKNDKMTMTSICNALTITKPNATILVDKLVKLGFVERETDKDDRRLVYIVLTKDGKLFIEKCKNNLRTKIKQILSSYSKKDLIKLDEALSIIKKLSEQLDDVYISNEQIKEKL
ncbi:MAG TPA: MarR family transcriptional regulator [Bacteroidota bacterium]|mgnify:CR=1 FL=1|jgi:DNA-binding MarR family transcriptional regulator|nr:MarR family transcriptional regulator [Bacteroidota bacterium]